MMQQHQHWRCLILILLRDTSLRRSKASVPTLIAVHVSLDLLRSLRLCDLRECSSQSDGKL